MRLRQSILPSFPVDDEFDEADDFWVGPNGTSGSNGFLTDEDSDGRPLTADSPLRGRSASGSSGAGGGFMVGGGDSREFSRGAGSGSGSRGSSFGDASGDGSGDGSRGSGGDSPGRG